MFDRSKLESLRDVSVTRIGDTLSYGFPQTVFEVWKHSTDKMKESGPCAHCGVRLGSVTV